MATKSILKRGFKADAERKAKAFREALSIHACAPLCAFKLAGHLSIPIYSALEFVTESNISLLNGADGREPEWSALTMTTEKGNRIIIHNPFNTAARQQSDIMHELAHVICEHKTSQVSYEFDIPLGMREFDEEQEEEAKCLGSTLQLSSPCLLWAKKRNMDVESMASHFNASVEMVNYRMNITGISRRP